MTAQFSGLEAFDLQESIGVGGMGEVWRAVHRRSGNDVAIKVSRGSYGPGGDRPEEVLREARVMAGVDHPGIVRILALGQLGDASIHHGLDPQDVFIAMEFADGGGTQVAEIASWAELRDFLEQVLDALAHTHARDIVHLDLKPDNILRFATPSGTWRYRLADFGISATAETLTGRAAISGTPLFMPPEQVEGQWWSFGPWTDLYALGCITWNIATGAAPFRRNNVMMTALAHVQDPVPEFEPRFAVPKHFEGWLRALLSKSPRDRFACAADAAAALVALGETRALSRSADATGVVSPTIRALEQTLADIETETMILAGDPSRSVAERPEAADEVKPQKADTPTAPMARNWELPPAPDAVRLVDAGLALFAFRETPMVGGRVARDRLWGEMLACRTEERPRLVVVKGAADVGKSRLARWLTIRLRELGQANQFVVEQGQHVGWRSALRAALERHFHLQGATTDELEGRVRDAMPSAGGALVDGISTLFARTQNFDSHLQVFALLDELFHNLARRRPALVVFDGAEREAFVCEYVEHALEQLDAPVMFVMTVDESSVLPAVARRLPDLRAEHISLQFPIDSEVEEFVSSLLPLEPETEAALREVAGESLSLARFNLAALIEREQLTPTDAGFTSSDTYFHHDAATLWQSRLETASRRVDLEAERVERAAAVLAAIGVRSDATLVDEVAGALEVRLDRDCMSVLESLALVSLDDGDYQFLDRAGWRAALELARRRGWLAEFDSVIAEQLDGEGRVDKERCAFHRWRAGDIAGALRAGRDVIQMSYGRDGEAVYEWLASIAEGVSDKEVKREWILTEIRQGLSRVHIGDYDGADDCFEAASRALDPTPDPELYAELGYAVATKLLFLTRYDEGLAALASSFAYFSKHGSEKAVAECLALRGDLYMYSGQLEKAQSDYTAVLAHWLESDSKLGQAWAHYRVGSLCDEMEDFAGVDEHLGAALEIFREVSDRNGVMLTKDILALAAFRQGRFERAGDLWNDVLDMSTAAGDQGRFLSHENLGRLAARTGDVDSALNHLAVVRDEAERSGFSVCVQFFWDAFAEAYARAARWEDVLESLRRGRKDAELADTTSPFLVPTLRQVRELADAAGRADVADVVDSLIETVVDE